MTAVVAATCASPAAIIFSVSIRLASASARDPPVARRSMRSAMTVARAALDCPIARCQFCRRLTYFRDDNVASYRVIYPALFPRECHHLIE